MGHSWKVFKANFQKYFGQFYVYFLRSIYWGSVPAIILYGLFSKPYSPMVVGLWNIITGQEEQQQPDYYGMPPQGAPGYY